MKSVAVTGERSCRIQTLPDPQASGDWVVIRVDTTPMCTEYKMYEGGFCHPHVGHEAAGEVVAVGRQGRIQVGDRVLALPLMFCGQCEYCQAGEYIYCLDRLDHGGSMSTYAQYHLKPEWGCYRLPDDIPTEDGALAVCGLGPSFGALQRMAVSAFDTVLITGMGPVGLGGVINAKHRGAKVIAVESHPYRMALAQSLGADHVLSPTDGDILEHIRELTGGRGVARALDCSGSPRAHRLCIDASRALGKVAFVGECAEETALRVSPDMIRKGLTLIGSWNYNLGDIPKLMQVIRREKSRLAQFVTHRFPLERVRDAWELQMTGRCGKVLLKPWENA